MLKRTENIHRTGFVLSPDEVRDMVYVYLNSIGETDYTRFSDLRITKNGGCILSVEKTTGIVPDLES